MGTASTRAGETRRCYSQALDKCGEAPAMFQPLAPAIDAFAKCLAANYREVFGKAEPDHAHLLRATAKLALECISGTDAPYHDTLHTLAVAEVGQAILRGRAMVEPVWRGGWR